MLSRSLLEYLAAFTKLPLKDEDAPQIHASHRIATGFAIGALVMDGGRLKITDLETSVCGKGIEFRSIGKPVRPFESDFSAARRLGSREQKRCETSQVLR
jgi:hypothetical protein